MVNFMRQLYWATGIPDIWLNIILWVSVKVFLMRFIFQSAYGEKKITRPNVGHPVNWRPDQNLHRWLSGVSSLPAANLGTSPYQVSQFLKINLFIYYTHTHIYTYILLVLLFWKNKSNPVTQRGMSQWDFWHQKRSWPKTPIEPFQFWRRGYSPKLWTLWWLYFPIVLKCVLKCFFFLSFFPIYFLSKRIVIHEYGKIFNHIVLQVKAKTSYLLLLPIGNYYWQFLMYPSRKLICLCQHIYMHRSFHLHKWDYTLRTVSCLAFFT